MRIRQFLEVARAHGRTYYYARIGRQRGIRLPDDPSSPEFEAAYQHACRILQQAEPSWNDALRVGIKRLTAPPSWSVTCATCGTQARGYINRRSRLPLLGLRRQDWRLEPGANPLCPACSDPLERPVARTLLDLLQQRRGRYAGTLGELLHALDDLTTRTFRHHSGGWPTTSAQLDQILTELEPTLAKRGIAIERRDNNRKAHRAILEIRATMTEDQSTPTVNLKIQRVVMALLEAHFDEASGHYRDGYGDTRVAREADVSEVAVARIRRDAFGELAEDPTITRLREDLELLRMEWEEGQARLGDELTALKASLEEQRAALQTRIEDLARAQDRRVIGDGQARRRPAGLAAAARAVAGGGGGLCRGQSGAVRRDGAGRAHAAPETRQYAYPMGSPGAGQGVRRSPT